VDQDGSVTGVPGTFYQISSNGAITVLYRPDQPSDRSPQLTSINGRPATWDPDNPGNISFIPGLGDPSDLNGDGYDDRTGFPVGVVPYSKSPTGLMYQGKPVNPDGSLYTGADGAEEPNVRTINGQPYIWDPGAGEYVPAPIRGGGGDTAVLRGGGGGGGGGGGFDMSQLARLLFAGGAGPGRGNSSLGAGDGGEGPSAAQLAQFGENEKQRAWDAAQRAMDRQWQQQQADQAAQLEAQWRNQDRAQRQTESLQQYGVNLDQIALSAADSYAQHIGDTDPAAFEAFLAAGGDSNAADWNISNALSMPGNTAVSEEAMKPAAQFLWRSRKAAEERDKVKTQLGGDIPMYATGTPRRGLARRYATGTFGKDRQYELPPNDPTPTTAQPATDNWWQGGTNPFEYPTETRPTAPYTGTRTNAGRKDTGKFGQQPSTPPPVTVPPMNVVAESPPAAAPSTPTTTANPAPNLNDPSQLYNYLKQQFPDNFDNTPRTYRIETDPATGQRRIVDNKGALQWAETPNPRGPGAPGGGRRTDAELLSDFQAKQARDQFNAGPNEWNAMGMTPEEWAARKGMAASLGIDVNDPNWNTPWFATRDGGNDPTGSNNSFLKYLDFRKKQLQPPADWLRNAAGVNALGYSGQQGIGIGGGYEPDNPRVSLEDYMMFGDLPNNKPTGEATDNLVPWSVTNNIPIVSPYENPNATYTDMAGNQYYYSWDKAPGAGSRSTAQTPTLAMVGSNWRDGVAAPAGMPLGGGYGGRAGLTAPQSGTPGPMTYNPAQFSTSGVSASVQDQPFRFGHYGGSYWNGKTPPFPLNQSFPFAKGGLTPTATSAAPSADQWGGYIDPQTGRWVPYPGSFGYGQYNSGTLKGGHPGGPAIVGDSLDNRPNPELVQEPGAPPYTVSRPTYVPNMPPGTNVVPFRSDMRQRGLQRPASGRGTAFTKGDVGWVPPMYATGTPVYTAPDGRQLNEQQNATRLARKSQRVQARQGWRQTHPNQPYNPVLPSWASTAEQRARERELERQAAMGYAARTNRDYSGAQWWRSDDGVQRYATGTFDSEGPVPPPGNQPPPGTTNPATPAPAPVPGDEYLPPVTGGGGATNPAADTAWRQLLQEVYDQRTGAKYAELQPMDPRWGMISPTVRERFLKGRADRFGIPIGDQEAEINRFALPGVGRLAMAR
jgi:hypothetical protein